jgi:hypothetical protein
LLAAFAALHIGYKIIGTERQARRTAINGKAYAGTVRFAENLYAEEGSKTVHVVINQF